MGGVILESIALLVIRYISMSGSVIGLCILPFCRDIRRPWGCGRKSRWWWDCIFAMRTSTYATRTWWGIQIASKFRLSTSKAWFPLRNLDLLWRSCATALVPISKISCGAHIRYIQSMKESRDSKQNFRIPLLILPTNIEYLLLSKHLLQIPQTWGGSEVALAL